MEITCSSKKDNLFIFLSGELDQSVSTFARSTLEDISTKNKYKYIIFDMKKLSFMDSTGIGVLLSFYKKMKQKNVPIYISEPNNQIDKLIRISGLYTVMPPV